MHIRSFTFSIPIGLFFILVMSFSLVDMALYYKYIIAITSSIIIAIATNFVIGYIEDRLTNHKTYQFIHNENDK
ncbi:UNVERIFIED_CONTAM: hypothetical protein O8I53_09735 [Campylobacter lari]